MASTAPTAPTSLEIATTAIAEFEIACAFHVVAARYPLNPLPALGALLELSTADELQESLFSFVWVLTFLVLFTRDLIMPVTAALEAEMLVAL